MTRRGRSACPPPASPPLPPARPPLAPPLPSPPLRRRRAAAAVHCGQPVVHLPPDPIRGLSGRKRRRRRAIERDPLWAAPRPPRSRPDPGQRGASRRTSLLSAAAPARQPGASFPRPVPAADGALGRAGGAGRARHVRGDKPADARVPRRRPRHPRGGRLGGGGRGLGAAGPRGAERARGGRGGGAGGAGGRGAGGHRRRGEGAAAAPGRGVAPRRRRRRPHVRREEPPDSGLPRRRGAPGRPPRRQQWLRGRGLAAEALQWAGGGRGDGAGGRGGTGDRGAAGGQGAGPGRGLAE